MSPRFSGGHLMDSWEWNKIAGAVLGTLIFVMVVGIVTDMIYHVEPPAKPGYVVEGVEEAPAAGGPVVAAVEQTPDWGTVLASADVAAGKAVFGRCTQCHDDSKGGPNKIGPELWSVVGRSLAHNPGFSYSAAMKKKGGNWTYDELFHFLKSPGSNVPGTKMSFAGLRSVQDRVNIIAYLRSQSDSPAPIPAPAPAAAPAEAAPAETAPDGAAPEATPAESAPATAP